MYAPTKILSNTQSSYTFDPINDPCNTVYLGERGCPQSTTTRCNLYLPDAVTFDGLVLSVLFKWNKTTYKQFMPVYVFPKIGTDQKINIGWSVDYFMDIFNTQRYAIVEDAYDNPETDYVAVRPNHLIQFQAIGGNWYVIAGCVQKSH